MSAEEQTMSKSARKRANQKARQAEEEGAAAAAAPPAPEPKAKAKAKAEPKAAPAPAPKAEPKAEAKAKAKGKAKAAPQEQPAEPPKAEAKPKPKPAAAKPKTQPKKEAPKEEAKPKAPEPDPWYQLDDGKGGEWEEASGLSKKQQKQKERREEKEVLQKQMQAAGAGKVAGPAQHIPGMPTQQDIVKAAKTEAKGKAAPQAAVAVVSAASAAAKDKEPEKAAVVDNSVSATVKIPDNKIGWVIGPKGATIAMIKEKTGVKTVDTSGGVCTIVGDKEAVGLAEHAVKELIEKGFTSLAFDNFQEFGIQVHPVYFPDIIGVKGCVIQAIKKEAKCEVSIPEVPKNSHPDKKFKITLSGASASVELGKEIINSIVQYGHHEVTHPGFIHKEIEVAEWNYKYLIGTKGSEMRHIQNSFHVKVNIPRPHSAIQNVVVVGESQDVERACKHIEKIMFNAEQPKGRGQADQAIDPWGEDEEEAWMSPYLYKRK